MGLNAACVTRSRAVCCHAGLARPSVKGTPLRAALSVVFNAVGPLLSAEQAAKSEKVMRTVAIAAAVCRALRGGCGERACMLSPWAVNELRHVTQRRAQTKKPTRVL